MFGWDVESVGSALRDHAHGKPVKSGILLDDVVANPIVGHCLEVRQEAFRTLPRNVTKGRGENADRCRDFIAEILPDIIPDGTIDDWHKHYVFMGESLSGMDWEERTDGRDRWWLPLIKPWHPSQTYHQYMPHLAERSPDGQALLAVTREHGPVLVEAGWGRWVHFSKGTLSPWLNGLIRALGEPYLGDTYTLRDNLALQERYGQGVTKMFHPVEWNAEQVDASIWSVRSSGRGGVISCPQTSDGKRRVDLENLPVEAGGAQLFDLTERRLLRRFLIALLGQDMTTVGQTGGFAQAAIHAQVLWHKRERDAAAFGDARLYVELDPAGRPRRRWIPYSGPIRTQILRWIALFNFGSFDCAPYVWWDATPPEDLAEKEKHEVDAGLKRSQALASLMGALPQLQATLYKSGLPPADVEFLLEQMGLKIWRPEDPEGLG